MQMNVLVLAKGLERYLFYYDDVSASEVIRMFGKYAADEDLSFSWFDAAVMTAKVRELKKQNKSPE